MVTPLFIKIYDIMCEKQQHLYITAQSSLSSGTLELSREKTLLIRLTNVSEIWNINMSVEIKRQPRMCLSASVKGEQLEMKSGNIYMLRSRNGLTVRIPVFLQVYRNNFEHYAVICRNQTLTNYSLYISLKHSVVMTSGKRGTDILVIPDGDQGMQVIFQTSNEAAATEWTSYLQPKPRQSAVRRTSSSFPKCNVMPYIAEHYDELDV